MGVQDVKCAGQAEQSQSEGAQHKPAEPSSRRLDLADGGAILLDPLFLRASWIQRRLNSALQAALSLSLKRQEAEGLLVADLEALERAAEVMNISFTTEPW